MLSLTNALFMKEMDFETMNLLQYSLILTRR